jgi:hypothetical protein
MQQAQFDWILSLDADEALSEELLKSIKHIKTISKQEINLFEMNRLTNYCGAWVKHCGWYPDTKVRLVNRKFAKWGGVNPHDKLEGSKQEKVAFLKGDILHYSYYTKEDHLKQIEYFSKIAAGELVKQGKNNPNFGIVQQPEWNQKKSEAQIGIPKPRFVCPNCNKSIGGKSNYYRWLGDNCSLNRA